MTTAVATTVRMGRWAVSADADDVLVTIGLGSCIGLVAVDRVHRIAGLAHIMLPASRGDVLEEEHGKYADLAVPLLIDRVLAAGARRIGLEIAVVGGAHMFSFGKGQLDVGHRNESAVRASLAALRLPVKAAATSGSKGRTVRVHVADGSVLVREAAGADEVLMGAPR
jgi:chemotaxis protein CheD